MQPAARAVVAMSSRGLQDVSERIVGSGEVTQSIKSLARELSSSDPQGPHEKLGGCSGHL